MLYSNLGFHACTRCAALEVGIVGLAVALLRCGHRARLLHSKMPFTTQFSCVAQLISLQTTELWAF